MSRLPRELRRQIRERANGRCEYCRMPDELVPYGHQIDHINPRKYGGLSTPENLAYACLRCSNSKGTDIAVYDTETGEIIPLYNPRVQKWDDHF